MFHFNSPGFMIEKFCKSLSRICIPLVLMLSCNETSQKPKPVEIVKKPEDLNKKTNENIASIIAFALVNTGNLNNDIKFNMLPVVKAWYDTRDSLRTWSYNKEWLGMADSLYGFVEQSERFGLFPSDYHFKELNLIHRKLKTDSLSMLDAALWARADILFTDAFMQITKDIKLGRLEPDSVTLRKDTTLTDSFYVSLLQKTFEAKTLTNFFEELEPHHEGYVKLRAALKGFVDSMDRKSYTYLAYPFEDSLAFIRDLQVRLAESGHPAKDTGTTDKAALTAAVKRYQAKHGLVVDGKAGPMVVKSLNNTDKEKFKRIAVNLDRYKHLPDTMPARYVWVNIPSYDLQVWDSDTLQLESKIIVGQPLTRTPLLTSALTNIILFPQWTVPYSIIFKEMLPKIREDVDYLNSQNLMVVDKNDSILDPHTINWFKLDEQHFPYLLKQREGDDNSLGVIKFNFSNKYSVYLHDTNARWLFSKPKRALSHGCVRVQRWDTLSRYLLKTDTARYKPDSIAAWMKKKEKHTLRLSERVPLFIRYFTCEVKKNRIVFFDDIYAEDKLIREEYFGNKD